MRFVLLGGILGEFDVKNGGLIYLSLLVLLTLEHGEVDAFQRDDDVQAGHASVESVGYQ